MQAAIHELGIKRYRLMSYWNIHEQSQGEYNFDELDWQFDMIAAVGGSVTMCLGARQPRWPEFHMPDWAKVLPAQEWHAALLQYIEIVVTRYQNHPALVSWQLENEALLQSFGDSSGDFDRARLRREFALVKTLDKVHPVIMTLSDSYGIPVHAPKPDAFAMSIYRITMNQKGQLKYSKRPALFYRLRALVIFVLRWRGVFIHELQAEPWESKAITQVPRAQQLAQMGTQRLTKNVHFAKSTGMNPVDLWGGDTCWG